MKIVCDRFQSNQYGAWATVSLPAAFFSSNAPAYYLLMFLVAKTKRKWRKCEISIRNRSRFYRFSDDAGVMVAIFRIDGTKDNRLYLLGQDTNQLISFFENREHL